MLGCNGKQQNEIMMLESNYDKRFAGVGVGAKAGVANGKIIICKHDSTLKKIGKSKNRATTLDRSPVFGAKSGSKAFQVALIMGPIFGKTNHKLIDKWIPICIAFGDA